MGQKIRHFGALMKKNWIIWKRTLGASICELVCPVVLMAIMIIARRLIDQSEIAEQSNFRNSILMGPMVYPQNTTMTQIPNVTANGTTRNPVSQAAILGLLYPELGAVYSQYTMNYAKFANFTQTNLTSQNSLVSFVPSHCYADRNDPVTPIIAVAGDSLYIDPLTRDLNQLFKLLNQTIGIYKEVLKQNKAAQAALVNAGIEINTDVDFKIKRFDSEQAIMDYMSSPNYQFSDDYPGICFGFSVREKELDDIDVKMFFSSEARDPDAQSIPSQINDAWSEFENKPDNRSFQRYTKQGYGMLQNWIANTVLRIKSGNNNSNIAFTLVPGRTNKYIEDDFGQVIGNMLPFFMLLIYVLPMYRLIARIVSEKETKARESMRMMGLNDFSYWLSWWVYYFIIVTIISLLVTAVVSFRVFKFSNKGLLFLVFWIYGLSLFGLAVFLQSFFSNSRAAAITGTLVYFGTSFLDSTVEDPLVSIPQKALASLFTTIGIRRGTVILGKFETSGVGITASNFSVVYQNYSLAICCIMMTVSLVVFFLVGIYFDNVLPSAYGLQKKWYYCLTKSYWCGDGRQRNPDAKNIISAKVKVTDQEAGKKDDEYFEAKYMDKKNFEPVSRDLRRQEDQNMILRIEDLEKTFENGFQAVKGVNLKMYNGQIFALLGHNGAGKTTTISMLTGLINSSKGSAEVLGYDLFNQMDEVRNFLGVCPQHDVLFDLLTPVEHLDIFCDFKGVDSKNKEEEIKKMLIDVDVYHHKDTMAGNLSGGSKRKLSVAIALIGGSKLVLLDEPTSGMDLSARRKLWNMLKKYKSNRIIILTTHYMDEADILGDRIGIMTGGQVFCLGSSLFLKNRFGVGYNLTMVKKTQGKIEDQMSKYLKANLGISIKLLSEVQSEISYQIPNEFSVKFKDFFNKFDNDLDSLGIRSYGISVTTLEEVFLKVGHGEEQQKEKLAIKQAEDINDSKDKLVFQVPASELSDYSISDPKHHVSSCNGFFKHLTALFLKRFFIYRRNVKSLLVEVLVPVILVLIGLGLSKVDRYFNQSPRPLEPQLYPQPQRILANQDLVVKSANAAANIQPQTLLQNLPSYQEYFDITYKSYPQYDLNNWNQTQQMAVKFDNDTFTNRYNQSVKPYRYGNFFIYEANNQSKQFKAAIFLNTSSQDVAVAYPQFLYEAILKSALGKPNLKFKVTTQPYPVTEKLKKRAAQRGGFIISFIVSIGFALIPSVIAAFILNEREKNLKHIQLISGMSLPAYWVSNLIFDIVKGLIPSGLVIALIYIFSYDYPCSWLMFILYPVGVVPFTYVMSFIFESENVGQTITIFLHFVFGGIGTIIVFILRIIESTSKVGDILAYVFKIIPSYCLTESIIYDAGKLAFTVTRPDLKRDSDWDLDLQGGNVLALCVHFAFWNLVLIAIELGAFKWTSCFYNLASKNKIPRKNIEELDLDEDVVEEDHRITTMNEKDKKNMQIRVSAFRKIYPSIFRDPIKAVERTSFGLEYGECFALLGINGAGKSTTFKALTCEIQPTQGEININGYDAQREFSQARKHIGYCPQHDAIFELMTVEEHLEYYARIKGIPEKYRYQLIETQIEEMQLTEHRKKAAGTLSGGNKRKLSVAMAIIGNPPIVLLDEPSAGMDPEARRFMWKVIAKISQQRKKSAVILTTHSMEEAEALSTKMGIMVTGGVFKCFGSSQHIKSKFGTGYEIEVKIKKLDPESIRQLGRTLSLDHSKLDDAQSQAQLIALKEIMRQNKIDEFLISELKQGGIGNDLVKESEDNGNGMVSLHTFINWIHVETAGMSIINALCQQFPTVEILEHYNDYYKIRIPRGDKSIGFVFGFIEGQKEKFKISEYSVSQTTLEQIFQTFANLRIDDHGNKLIFKKSASSPRAVLYIDHQAPLKKQLSSGSRTLHTERIS